MRKLGALSVMFVVAASLVLARPAAAATFTVVNTNNSGAGSLRQAMLDANGSVATHDSIVFNIPGDGPHTITPITALPLIVDFGVTIDGYTQGNGTAATSDDATENTLAEGTNAVLKIVISGASLGGSNPILNLAGTQPSTIRGLVLNGSTGTGAAILSISLVNGHVVEGNFIGTDATGTTAVPNAGSGLQFGNGGPNAAATIGGDAPVARNVISGNAGNGIQASADGTVIRNNIIGLAANGSSPLPNGANGVRVAANGITIVDNQIGSNVDLGIDLAVGDADGPTPNDKLDRDTGSNGLQNFPKLTSARRSTDGVITIKGSLKSLRRQTFTLEFFANSAAADPEGTVPLGDLVVKTNRDGIASFRFLTLVTAFNGSSVTATATRFSNGDTSEFTTPPAIVEQL